MARLAAATATLMAIAGSISAHPDGPVTTIGAERVRRANCTIVL